MMAVRTLDRIAAATPDLRGVRASDVRPGDWVLVRTRNSVYSLAALGDGRFAASGGWFAADGAAATPIRVVGCTWGGSAIVTGLVAAPDMYVEFENGVRTTRVSEVQLIRDGEPLTIH